MSRVLLITGPGGSGKTTLAQALADRLGWVHVGEDDHWVRSGWDTGARTPEQEGGIQAQVVDEVLGAIGAGRGVVVDLILYALPPSPLTAYQDALSAHGVANETIGLSPTVDEIVARMTARGRPTDLADLPARRFQAEWQLHCVRSAGVAPERVVDPTGLTVAETVDRCLALLEA